MTHLYELARRLSGDTTDGVLSLRAERLPDGTRTFKVREARPLPTSFGNDVYEAVFGSRQPSSSGGCGCRGDAGLSLGTREGLPPRVLGPMAQLTLDAQQPLGRGHALGAREGAPAFSWPPVKGGATPCMVVSKIACTAGKIRASPRGPLRSAPDGRTPISRRSWRWRPAAPRCA